MNKYHRGVILLITAVFLSALWCGYWHGVCAEPVQAYNAGSLIRFHVVANSDSPADQVLKYRVRDAVVRAMSQKFSGINDIESARAVASANLGCIEKIAREQLRAGGRDYPVTVSLGQYDFPDKRYQVKSAEGSTTKEMTLPAGEYEAVRVVLGSGGGANWWCVLFPPLCFVDPTSVTSVTGTGDPLLAEEIGKDIAGADDTVRDSTTDDESIDAFKHKETEKEMVVSPGEKSIDQVRPVNSASIQGGPIIKFRVVEALEKSAAWLNRVWDRKDVSVAG